MIRKLSALTIVAAIVIACTSMLTSPAHAASQATATSVSLSAGDDCNRADLDLGLQSGNVDREYGLSTNAAGATLDQFENDGSALDNLDGVFNGYGIGITPDQPDGTIIGTYAYLGSTPPLAATTAEWFVLYRCGFGGENQVMFTCFGDYGTCPRTATQGLTALLGVTVSTATPAPGETVVVTATGCTLDLGSVAAVSLLRDGTLLTGVFPDHPESRRQLSSADHGPRRRSARHSSRRTHGVRRRRCRGRELRHRSHGNRRRAVIGANRAHYRHRTRRFDESAFHRLGTARSGRTLRPR